MGYRHWSSATRWYRNHKTTLLRAMANAVFTSMNERVSARDYKCNGKIRAQNNQPIVQKTQKSPGMKESDVINGAEIRMVDIGCAILKWMMMELEWKEGWLIFEFFCVIAWVSSCFKVRFGM